MDTLVDVEVTEERTILTAEGGEELKQRVQESVQFEDAHVVAEDLVSSNTGYATNFDDPASSTDEVLMQDVDDQVVWEDILPAYPFGSDDPRYIQDGQLQTYETALFRRAENPSQSNWDPIEGGRFENFEARMSNAIGTDIEWIVDLDYEIPASEVAVCFRAEYEGSTHPGFEIKLNGEVLYSATADRDITDQPMPRWFVTIDDPSTALSPGSHTIRIDITSAAEDDSFLFVDAVALVDFRYTPEIVDDDLSNGGQLSWPPLHPVIQTETDDADALNQVVGGRLEAGYDDISEDQALALSNDQGSTWEVTDSNTDSLKGSFADGAAQIRARFTQSYYDSGSGPVQFDAGQSVDLYQLFADQQDVPALVDRSFDARLVDVLGTIAEDKDFLWELRVDQDYNFSVEWCQPGQRTSDDTADISSYSVSKNTAEAVEKAVIKGGRQTERGETFTANHGTWVDLSRDNLIEGVEAVYNTSDGTQYSRGDDYEVDYLQGRIKTLSTGALSDGADYRADYDYQPQASYTAEGVSDPKTIVRNVPSIHSEQTARQLAYTLVTRYGDAVYSAEIEIPRRPAGWSVIDEIDPEQVPTAGKALQLNDIETSLPSIFVLAESQQTLDAVISRFEQRLGATEGRV